MAWHLTALNGLVHAALGGAVCLLIGGLAVCCCRQPARRIRLIELTLLGALLVPLVQLLPGLPHWRAGWLALTSPEAVVVRESAPAAVSPTDARLLPEAPAAFPAVPAAPATALGESPSAITTREWAPALSAPLLIVTAYACVVVSLLAWVAFGLLRAVRLCRTTAPAPPHAVALLREIAGPRAGRVRLLVSGRVESPLALAGWRPVIVLPAILCRGGNPEALRYCLAHEWSHVERGDAWGWYLATLAQAVLFYQPLFWWLRRQLRLCQDYLADARAAELAPEAEDYAEYLVGLARCRLAVPAVALGIGDRRSNLYRRVTMLLQNREPLERRCFAPWTWAATLAALVVLTAVAAVRLDAGVPADDPKDTPAKEAPKETPKDKPATQGETLNYTGRVIDKDTGKPVAGATVTVRRSLLGDPKAGVYNKVLQETKHQTDAEGKYQFTIPPEQSGERYLYIELDVEHPAYAPRKHFGYALSMIRKNEKLGGRPFFDHVEVRPGKEITGVVRTPEGEPAAGVKVLAYSNTANTGGRFEYGSFADTRTDASGRFRLVVITPGPAVFWILPEKYAPSTHGVKGDKRGDLGTFTLTKGITIRGKVVDTKGQPLAGVNVNAVNAEPNEALEGLSVADSINRSAITDARGEFQMAPLPPGTYTVQPDEHVRDGSKNDRKQYAMPAVFVPQKIALKEGAEPQPVEVRAVPHVTIMAQHVDSKGKPTSGHEFFVFGRLDGQFWHTRANRDGLGKYVVNVPHGLEQVQLDLMTNEHGVLRWRRGQDGPLNNQRRVDLGTVTDDVKDIEIVRYTAPILLVKVTGKDGLTLKDVAVTAVYPEGKGQYSGRLILRNGRQSDVNFEHQNDGRFRSSQLFPDQDVTVTAHAEGCEDKSATLKVAEGATREIELVLEKAPPKKGGQ
jgi:beta-lactamase regulating signal transducer with metallopeptidase domain/uncharacterized GH25 family protein